VVARWITYLAGLTAAGAAVVLWATHAGDARSVGFTRLAAVVGSVGSLVQIPLFAAESTGLGIGAWSSLPALGDAVASPVGRAALVRTAALVVVASATRLPRPAGWVWLGAGGAVAAELLAGHTLTTEPWLLVVGADLIHVTAAAVWLGGLACLVLLVRSARRHDDSVAAARVVGHFSRLATWSVAALAVAGLVLAWAEVRTLTALTSTRYGWTLLAKTVLAALVLGAGAYNNRILVPAITREASSSRNSGKGAVATATVPPSTAWAKLGRTLRFEVGGLVAVLALTAVLVNLQPAAEASGVSGPFSAYLDFGDGQVNIVVDPNRVGANHIHAYILTASGSPAELAGEAVLELRLPVEDIGPIVRQPILAGPGHWIHTGSDLAIAGSWEVTFRVLSDFEEQTATATVNVNG
jgi:copper transport protein